MFNNMNDIVCYITYIFVIDLFPYYLVYTIFFLVYICFFVLYKLFLTCYFTRCIT